MPTTLRIELDKLGYDWDKGTMVLQPGRGYEPPGAGKLVKRSDPLLEQVFSNGASLDLPRFMASDKQGHYVVFKNHLGSGLKRIKRADDYIGSKDAIPYPD